MRILLKILTLILSQIAGFVSAVLTYESIKIVLGYAYEKPVWGIDIPFIYQTKEIYLYYCASLSAWLLILCVSGVIAAIKNKRIIPLLVSFLILVTLFLMVYLNGSYAPH